MLLKKFFSPHKKDLSSLQEDAMVRKSFDSFVPGGDDDITRRSFDTSSLHPSGNLDPKPGRKLSFFFPIRKSLDKSSSQNNTNSNNNKENKKDQPKTPRGETNGKHSIDLGIVQNNDDLSDSDGDEYLANELEQQLLDDTFNEPLLYCPYSADKLDNCTTHTSNKPIKPFRHIQIGELKLLNLHPKKQEEGKENIKSEMYVIIELREYKLMGGNFFYKLPLLSKNEFLEWKDCDVDFPYDGLTDKRSMRFSYSMSSHLEDLENSYSKYHQEEQFDNLIIPSGYLIDKLTKDYLSIRVYERKKHVNNSTSSNENNVNSSSTNVEDKLIGEISIDLFTIALHPFIDFIGVNLTDESKAATDWIVSFSIITSKTPPTLNSHKLWTPMEDSLIIQGQYINPFTSPYIE